MRNAGAAFFVIILVALVALLFFAPWQGGRFERSALGSKGLEVWLQDNGIPVIRSDSHVKRARNELSLRILPLQGPVKNANGSTADSNDGQEGMETWVLEEKLYELTTLVILPKWKKTILKDSIARQSGLLPITDIHSQLDALYMADLAVKRLGQGFSEADAAGGERPAKIALYSAQLFDRTSIPDFCSEMTGMKEGALILRCEADYTVYLLSDPDLLNNHGLAMAENAGYALSLIKNLRGIEETRPVYLDTNAQLLNEEESVDESRTYERSATDMARFFEYPLTVIWGAILLVTIVCFWRGAYRFGPPVQNAEGHIEISKTAAVEAMARLLRLSGNDGRMAAQFAHSLLIDKAVLTFGAGAGNQAGIERLYEHLSRRNKDFAQSLRSVATALIERGPAMSRSELHHNLEKFRTLLRSTDFGSR